MNAINNLTQVILSGVGKTNLTHCRTFTARSVLKEIELRLRSGGAFTNPKLTKLAISILGGTRLEGVFTSKDAYDALEVAVNRHLLKRYAIALMQMAEPKLGLTYLLRPLLQ